MLIHFTLVVRNLQNHPIVVAAFFYSDDGTPLRNSDRKYAGPNGQVSVQEKSVPPYEETLWKDYRLFLPYEQLRMEGTGKASLMYRIGAFQLEADHPLVTSDAVYFEKAFVKGRAKIAKE